MRARGWAVRVTRDFVVENKSPNGGWCAAQLLMLGISWPPCKGWLDDIDSRNVEFSREQVAAFVGYSLGTVSKTGIRKVNRQHGKFQKR